MSKYDTTAVKTFDNEVWELKVEDQLITHLDMMQFAHADYDLAEEAGMTKKIRTYYGSGDIEELAMGEGNSTVMGSDFRLAEYEVKTYQGKGEYFDEQLMNDPKAIDTLVNYMSTAMVNDVSKKVPAELAKTIYKLYGQTFNFDCVADAISLLPEELTEDEGLFILIARKDKALWRKNLKDDLKYVEDFVRRGYIGHVCGVPCFYSDAVPQGKAFLGTSEAVTVFVKKGVEIEPERDAEHRKNKLFIRKVALVALTNSKKMIEIRAAADPRDAYNLLATAPQNWATNYNDYYTFDDVNGAMVKNAFEAAPEFVEDKFYAAK